MNPPASSPSASAKTLDVLSGSRRGAKIPLGPLSGSGLSIGRAPQNQLVLADDHLSSEHGQIFREGTRLLFRDFKSTNGSRVLRKNGALVAVDASCGYEVELHEGDQLLLGDPQSPVAVLLRGESSATTVAAAPSPGDSGETEVGRVLARRALTEAEAVAGKVERDPQVAAMLLSTTKKLGRRGLDLQAVFEGLTEAVFELLPLATHIAVELDDGPDGRMATVYTGARRSEAKAEATKADAKPDAKADTKSDAKSDAKGDAKATPLRASRAVVRRVLQERAAVLIANAAQDLAGVASIMGARIQSILGVPLWEGEDIRGVIQVDNRASSAMFKERDLEVLLVLAGLGTLAIENARLHQRLRMAEEQARGEARFLKNSEEKRRAPSPIGQSPAMREVLRQVEKVQATRATVCIEGETGTGKELVASLIHYQSPRRDKLFVAQNCAAVPENLLESELFGHKKGAFTGADSDKKGLFEVADGGSLFLDEIAETSLGLQAKLLRVLQESEIRPVGATQPRKVDVRIICATNRSLEKEVAEGRFRQDLYYRLKVFPLRLPPLRERRDDVPLLAEHFLKKYAQEIKKPISGFTPDTLSQLASYNWPGNVRELENEVQRLCIQVEPDHFITPDLLAPHMRQAEGVVDRIAPKKGPLKDMLEEVERFLILQCLKEHDGNKTRAAEALGITREGLHKKLARFGL